MNKEEYLHKVSEAFRDDSTVNHIISGHDANVSDLFAIYKWLGSKIENIAKEDYQDHKSTNREQRKDDNT